MCQLHYAFNRIYQKANYTCITYSSTIINLRIILYHDVLASFHHSSACRWRLKLIHIVYWYSLLGQNCSKTFSLLHSHQASTHAYLWQLITDKISSTLCSDVWFKNNAVHTITFMRSIYIKPGTVHTYRKLITDSRTLMCLDSQVNTIVLHRATNSTHYFNYISPAAVHSHAQLIADDEVHQQLHRKNM